MQPSIACGDGLGRGRVAGLDEGQGHFGIVDAHTPRCHYGMRYGGVTGMVSTDAPNYRALQKIDEAAL
jgi:hypothetical protein